MYNKFENDIKNLKGTLAIEDMSVNGDLISDLRKVSEGKASYAELLAKAKEKYMQRA